MSFLLAALLSLGTFNVTTTAYSLDRKQTDSTPLVAACGRARKDMIAVSRDLFKGGRSCGKKVEVKVGKLTFRRTVWDTMSPRHKLTVDILFATYAEAKRFGVRRGILRFL